MSRAFIDNTYQLIFVVLFSQIFLEQSLSDQIIVVFSAVDFCIYFVILVLAIATHTC